MIKPMNYSGLPAPMLFDLYRFYKEQSWLQDAHLNLLADDYGAQAELVLQEIHNRDCPAPM